MSALILVLVVLMILKIFISPFCQGLWERISRPKDQEPPPNPCLQDDDFLPPILMYDTGDMAGKQLNKLRPQDLKWITIILVILTCFTGPIGLVFLVLWLALCWYWKKEKLGPWQPEKPGT